MQTRKNNRNRNRSKGGTNIAINNTTTNNTAASSTTILSINPKPHKVPRRYSNAIQSTKQILNITIKNVNQSGKKFNTDISIYTVALNEIDWIMKSLPYFGADANKKTMDNIRKDIEVLQNLSDIPINNTKKDNIKPIIDHIGFLLEKLKNLNSKMQSIYNNKLGSSITMINKNTLFKKVGEDIVRMFAFSNKYIKLFTTMHMQLQSFRNK
jgi:hypothetical protein